MKLCINCKHHKRFISYHVLYEDRCTLSRKHYVDSDFKQFEKCEILNSDGECKNFTEKLTIKSIIRKLLDRYTKK